MIKVEDIYPITKRTHPHEEHEYVFITDDDIKEYTPPAYLSSLYDFLSGQTRYMWEIYPGDVERWLNRLPNLD